MKAKGIAEILENIKDKYRNLYQITETANFDSDPAESLKFIEKRNNLLTEITVDQACLEKNHGDWHTECANNERLHKTLQEIGSFIAMIVALDAVLSERLSKRVQTLKNDISDFNRSSKMALSYARNTIIPNSR